MSTADEAWDEYATNDHNGRWGTQHTAFMAGYRRALEDAADAVKEVRDGGLPPSCHSHPTHQYIENWLRARASGVGTKDGADDE